ncbi:MAG: cytochrome c [Saprospiraceae bacterium]|nr:cytochrome c [Saprospiraceae bacterium]
MRLLAGLSFFFLLMFACTSEPSQNTDKVVVGEQLAKVHCASCHQYPTPEFLDKKTWKNYILPRMGYMMGICQ